jgi:hypothetical protein
VIVVAVRWYLRFTLSYRDLEELLVERGVEVDHVTVFRWVQRFTPLLADGRGRNRRATISWPAARSVASASATASFWSRLTNTHRQPAGSRAREPEPTASGAPYGQGATLPIRHLPVLVAADKPSPVPWWRRWQWTVAADRRFREPV